MDGNESSYQISKGDLVRWYELYDEGIVKDSGLGTIFAIRESPVHDGTFVVMYEIWRHIKNDFFYCGPSEIKTIK